MFWRSSGVHLPQRSQQAQSWHTHSLVWICCLQGAALICAVAEMPWSNNQPHTPGTASSSPGSLHTTAPTRAHPTVWKGTDSGFAGAAFQSCTPFYHQPKLEKPKFRRASQCPPHVPCSLPTSLLSGGAFCLSPGMRNCSIPSFAKVCLVSNIKTLAWKQPVRDIYLNTHIKMVLTQHTQSRTNGKLSTSKMAKTLQKR